MDIQEIKNFAKNKIEADDLAKQVRRRKKETVWEKQNRREGFTETFKPLISQFEEPEDSKKENIFTQNQEMLQNQLALTEGIKNNQLAIKGLTDKQDIFNRGFKQFERLADIEELPGNVWEETQGNVLKQEIEPPKTGELIQFEDDSKTKEDKPKDDYFDLNQRFGYEKLKKIGKYGLNDLNSLLLNDNEVLKIYFKDVNKKIKKLNGIIRGNSNKPDKTQEDIDFIIKKKEEQDILIDYKDTIADIIKAKEKYQIGQGIFFYSPKN